MKPGVQFDVYLHFFSRFFGQLVQKLRLPQTEDGRGNVEIYDVRKVFVRCMSHDKNRIGWVSFFDFDGFRQGRHREIVRAAFHQSFGDADRAVTVCVGLDYSCKGSVRTDQLADQPHVVREFL